MGPNRHIEDLDPRMKPLVERFLFALRAAGIAVTVIETRRNQAVQSAYYAQGREPLDQVNRLRKTAGLWEIRADENRRIVTNAPIVGKHGQGLAVDIVPLDNNGRAWWSAPSGLWQRIGEIGKSCGLRWGGDWKRLKDYPHFEI